MTSTMFDDLSNATTTSNLAANTSRADEDGETEALMHMLQIVMDVLLITLSVLLMLSFGCSLAVSQLRHHLSQPIGVTLGILLHFIVVPYCFFAILNVVDFDDYDRVSLTVLATSPSGGISNMFVEYAEGELALGIIIVAVSTVLALGFMPLNMWLFSQDWNQTVVVPYIQTVISLVTILFPTAIGMVILRRSKRVALWVSRVSSAVATLMIIATIALSSYMYPEMYSSTWKTWFLSAMYTPISFLIGYLIAGAMRMPDAIRRTLGITTGSKGLALCLTIIALSFSKHEYLKYLVLPELHSVFMLVELALYCAIYRTYRLCNGKYFMRQEVTSHCNDMAEIDTSVISSSETPNGETVTSLDVNTTGLAQHKINRTVIRRMSDGLLSAPSVQIISNGRQNA